MILILLLGIIIGVCAIGGLIAVVWFFNAKASRAISRVAANVRDRAIRAGGGVPWLPKDLATITGEPGTREHFFVSRHHLAEGGLTCPLCEEQIASGDFSQVYRTYVDGVENEVIVCQGKRIVANNREVKCGAVLVASPDTEHGDHLNDDGTIDASSELAPEHRCFVRAPADQWLREKWGTESQPKQVGQTATGYEVVDVQDDPAASAAAPPTRTGLDRPLEDIQRTIHAIEAGHAEAAANADTAVLPAIKPPTQG